MRVDSISLRNFFNHASTDIDFTDVESPTLINGSNGAGKTSAMVESLTYALFGETRLANIDDAIRNNEDSMSVSITFFLNNQEITVTRSKKRGKGQKLELKVDGVNVEELLSETQKRIDKLIGLSFETFRSSVLLKQDDSNFFVKAKPDERKKIIGEILNLNQYEKYEKIAKERRSNVKAEIKTLQTLLNNFEEFDLLELKSDLQKISDFIANHSKKIVKAESKLAEINEWNSKVDEEIKRYNKVESNNKNIQSKIINLQESIESKKSAIKKLNNLLDSSDKNVSQTIKDLKAIVEKYESDISNCYDVISESKQKYSDIINSRMEKIQAQINNVEQKISLVESNVSIDTKKLDKIHDASEADCPTCLRPMDGKEVHDIIHELETRVSNNEETLALLNIGRHQLLSERKDIKNGDFEEAKIHAEELLKTNDILSNMKKKLLVSKDKLEEAIDEEQKIAVAQERLSNIEESIKNEISNLNFLKTQIEDLPEITLERIDDDQARQKVKELKRQEIEGIEAQASIKSSISKAEKDAVKKEQYLEQIKSNQHQLELLDSVCIAFSKNGIPAAIIETVLPEIEETANLYLDKMSDSGFELSFTTVAVMKNGEEKGTLDVEVFDGTVWRNFESLSGGEQLRVSLSIRLSLSKILSKRANIELETLILDEPGVFLDEQGLQSFVSVVISLKEFFPRIIIMSHLPSLNNQFDNRIQLNPSY